MKSCVLGMIVLGALFSAPAMAVPISMYHAGSAQGVTSVINFTYEDSVVNSGDSYSAMFAGALTDFTVAFSDGLTLTLDQSAANSVRLTMRVGYVVFRMGAELVDSNGDRYFLSSSTEVGYVGSRELADISLTGIDWSHPYETVFFIEGGTQDENGQWSFQRIPNGSGLRPVPEPSSLALLSLGLIGIAVRRRRAG